MAGIHSASPSTYDAFFHGLGGSLPFRISLTREGDPWIASNPTPRQGVAPIRNAASNQGAGNVNHWLGSSLGWSPAWHVSAHPHRCWFRDLPLRAERPPGNQAITRSPTSSLPRVSGLIDIARSRLTQATEVAISIGIAKPRCMLIAR